MTKSTVKMKLIGSCVLHLHVVDCKKIGNEADIYDLCNSGQSSYYTLYKISFPPFEALICATCSGVSMSLLPFGSAKA